MQDNGLIIHKLKLYQ